MEQPLSAGLLSTASIAETERLTSIAAPFTEKRRPELAVMRGELYTIHIAIADAILAAGLYGDSYRIAKKAATDAYLIGIERGAAMGRKR